MASALTRVAEQTAQQLGLVSRRQALAAQVSPTELVGLVRAGLLLTMRRGVYRLGGAPTSWEQALLAAVLDAGEGAVASHASAARLWDFDFVGDEGFEITVPRPRCPVVRGVDVHTSSRLVDVDLTIRRQVPCTTFERTLCDSTTRLSLLQASRVLDHGLRRDITTMDRVRACVLRLDSGPHRRLRVMQALLEQRDGAYNPGGSNAELRVLDVVEQARLPRPEQQVRVRAGRRTYFLDYAYPDSMCFVEYYELRSHGTPSSVAYDSDRITDLCNLGWRPVIVTDMNTDAEIAAKITEALATAPTRTALSA